MKLSAKICLGCKGKDPRSNCGYTYCPLLKKAQEIYNIKKHLPEKEFTGVAPTPFVGRYGYPNIQLGLLSTPQAAQPEELDNPRYWAAKKYEIPKIVSFRSALINARRETSVQAPQMNNKHLDICQEVSQAKKPVQVDVEAKDKPRFRIRNDAVVAPHGPTTELVRATLTENPTVSKKVQRAVDDTDLKAVTAVNELYNKGVDENKLSRILSVGSLGRGRHRTLVPTRSSITAVDDTVGKGIIKEVKDYRRHDLAVFSGQYLGNHYLILLFPEVWSYELFETYMPRSSWNVEDELVFMTDYEPYRGRKTYVSETAGGYYAARLPILDYLRRKKRQAAVLAIRVITDQYVIPLGVWVVREAVRKAMQSSPLKFSSKELMLQYIHHQLAKRHGVPFPKIKRSSLLLKEMRQQTKLAAFS